MTEVATIVTRLTNEELRAIESTADVLQLFQDKGAVVTDLSEVLGSGFEVVPTKHKGKLVDVGFLILEWNFTQGDKGEFVSLTVVTEDNRKLILNDGSTGIRDQIKELEQNGVFAPVLVRKGLRESVYYYDSAEPGTKYKDDAEGREKATTYYLAV